jgi:soluble lytic murein transglycosylase-like protein
MIPSDSAGAAVAEQKTLGFTKTYRYNLINKVKRICFLIAGGTIAAQCLSADPASLESDRTVEKRLTSVVRADSKSGHLVRSVVVKRRSSAGTTAATRKNERTSEAGITDVGSIIEQTARIHDIDPLLVHSMVKAESNYNPFAVSPKGAMGLMQLMPATARELGVKDVFDARENIDGGVRYYKYLRDLYNNDDRLALAAYNAGPGAVAKYGTVPPFPETIAYVRKIGKSYGKASPPAEPQVAAVPQDAAAPEQEQYSKLVEVVDAEGRIYLRSR